MRFFNCSLPVVFLLLSISLFPACSSDTAGPDPATRKTTIAGRVIDEQGRPLPGTTVRGHGATTTTDANGFFMLKDLTVPDDRCVVTCSASGYFNGAGATRPRINGATPMEITLVEAVVVATVDAADPERVVLDAGGEIELPANGFQLESGAAYTGDVDVLARQLDPDSEEFGRLFPGDILAQRADGSEASLLSYGVIIAELRGASGQKLKLAPGRTATLSFPIPSSMQSNAPASIPLWYFDESIGRWKEEGSATRSGDMYVGKVSHFTPWNCDDPMGTPCYLHLHVVTRKGKPAGGVRVRVGQIIFITDANGDVKAYGTQQTTAQVPPELNFGIGSDVVDVACVAGQSVERTIVIDGATVSGMIIGCDGRPIPSLAYATWGTGQTNHVASPGIFNMLVPAGERLTVHALGGSSRQVGPLAPGDSVDVGSLVICPGGGSDRPGKGTVFTMHLISIDENGNQIPGIDTTLLAPLFAVDTTFMGKPHVNMASYMFIAHESNGDISKLAELGIANDGFLGNDVQEFWFPQFPEWIVLPVTTKSSRTLPTFTPLDDTSHHVNGSITYEGTEQLTINGQQHTSQRITFSWVDEDFRDDNGALDRRETSVVTYWYVADLDFIVKTDARNLVDNGSGNPKFIGHRMTVVSYVRK